MKTLNWLNDREFTLDGIRFYCAVDDFSRRTDAEHVVLLKDRATLANYEVALADLNPRAVLEFGIFQGGSPALFASWFKVETFVGIDICKPVAEFEDLCRRHPVGRTIRSYYGVSQTDKGAVLDVIRKEFGDAPVDLIIDDASHLYRASRRTFEITFPRLRPGGYYVIEDWGWAHWPGVSLHSGRTALSMLIMELAMVCTSRRDLISEVRVFPSFAVIKKAPEARHVPDFDLRSLYTKRDIELVGSEDQSLAGIVQLVGRRLIDSVLKKAGRKHSASRAK